MDGNGFHADFIFFNCCKNNSIKSFRIFIYSDQLLLK